MDREEDESMVLFGIACLYLYALHMRVGFAYGTAVIIDTTSCYYFMSAVLGSRHIVRIAKNAFLVPRAVFVFA